MSKLLFFFSPKIESTVEIRIEIRRGSVAFLGKLIFPEIQISVFVSFIDKSI